jgi:predicted dehydrogenase
MSGTLPVGVVGVGSMGRNHVRVYDSLPSVDLVGIADADEDRAAEVGAEYGVESTTLDDLFTRVEALSIAVPTEYHADLVEQCIDQGVHALVEKPFVAEPSEGRRLAREAREAGVTLQVGHIERFNPAVQALQEFIDELDVVAIEAHRLGPPVNRQTTDSVIMDLMIHDIDVAMALVGEDVEAVDVMSTASEQHASAQLRFANDVNVSLTASRVTQRKVRRLRVTAASCLVELDYIDQSIDIFRHSNPEFTDRGDGDLAFRHENVIERPIIESAEPLKEELRSFVDCVVEGHKPVVSADGATDVLELTQHIEQLATESSDQFSQEVSVQ